MNKREIISAVALRTGIQRKRCAEIIDVFVDEMRDAVRRGDGIRIDNFAKFEVVDTPPVKRRDPQTGNVVTFPAAKKVVCRISKTLKDIVNDRV